MIDAATALTEKALEALLILTAHDEENVTPQELETDLWQLVGFFCPDLTSQQHQMEYD